MDQEEIIVGGAGIIGLAAGLELAHNGRRVRVIERGKPMREASWAAAGMLAAEDPENPAELSELALLSRKLYPEFLALVEELSGKSVPIRTDRVLQLSRPHEPFSCPASPTRTPTTAEQARRSIPGLNPGPRSLLWLEEASLDPRDLCAALPAAAVRAGVVIEEGNEILAIEGRGDGVIVSTAQGPRPAHAFINCCGSWSSSISGSFPNRAAVDPRKGQMIAVRLESAPALECVLRTPSVYVVPRGDGRIIIGATVERAGFDRSLDPAVVDQLMARAVDIWPPIAQSKVIDRWMGFRPGTADQLPYIGPALSAHCWDATGHVRGGILLTPATARVVRLMMENKAPGVDLERFRPDRVRPSADGLSL